MPKKPAKLLYFIMIIRYTQVFGFTPFGFDVIKFKAVASKAWSLHAKLFTLTLSLFTILYLRFYSRLFMVNTKFNILHIVKRVDNCSGCLKMILSHWIQIYNRTKLINTINLAIVIGNNLRYLRPSEGFFAKSFWKYSRRVYVTQLAQIMLFTSLCYDSWDGLAAMNTHIVYIDFVLASYYNIGISIIIVKIFYCSGMIAGIRLYEMVNQSIMVSSMKRSKKIGAVREVEQKMDHLILISSKIRYFVDSINELFSTQIMFVIIGCFLTMLSCLYYISIDLLSLYRLNEHGDTHILKNITRVMFYLLELYNICTVTQAAMAEARRTSTLIHKYNKSLSSRSQKILELSSMQLLNNSVHLSVWNMLRVDRTILIGVASALFAYITLLVQFEMSE